MDQIPKHAPCECFRHGSNWRASLWANYSARSIGTGTCKPDASHAFDVARVVKKLMRRSGVDLAKYAGHSLRAWHATAAAIADASERSIMSQTGHRSVQMVRRYIREGSLFREN
jgi:integrase